MEVFGQRLSDGYFKTGDKDTEIVYKVEKITNGYKISGKIRGKLGRIKVFEIQRPKGALYLNNWQSWGLFLSEEEYKGVIEGYKERKIGIYTYTPIPYIFKEELISDYFLLGEDILLGFLTSKIAHPFYIVKDNVLEGWLEYFDTEFDDYIPIESFVILTSSPHYILLGIYSDLVKKENGIRVNNVNPIGWSSWYQYFLDLKWKDILENLELSKKMNMPYEVFQIDDGYEKDIGDWFSTKEGFPGVKEMAKIIEGYGYTPGIWTAPLSISETSQIYKENKGWLVKENDTPKKAYYNWERDIYALDITVPEAKNWLYNLFSKLKEAGFNYFKIDFLFAGALPGMRKENITPIQAYRDALSTIRRAVGDSFILGCGAPLLPSLGIVDGMRIGPDTAPFWKKDEKKSDINAYWALKNSITRWFMHKKWWMNDPDCLLLRPKDTDLLPTQRKLYGVVSAILDNMIIQSDNLSYITEEEKALLKEVLSYREGRPKVKFIDKDLFTLSVEGSGRGNVEIAVNLDEKPAIYEKREIPPFSYIPIKEDEEGIRLSKKPIKREDGRIFTYYGKEERDN